MVRVRYIDLSKHWISNKLKIMNKVKKIFYLNWNLQFLAFLTIIYVVFSNFQVGQQVR